MADTNVVRPGDPAPTSEEGAEMNEKARLAQELREVIATALSVGDHIAVDANGGGKVPHFNAPNWSSMYYRLKYKKPAETFIKETPLLRTARGDLTHEELAGLLHTQMQRFNVDADVDGKLSDRIARLATWRYGIMLDLETRREVGPEHRNEMNEHRFNRLEEQLATIVEAGGSQWEELSYIKSNLQVVTAAAYTGKPGQGGPIVAAGIVPVGDV
jgi:hypothetical protein